MASPGPASGSGAADRGRGEDERAEFSALLEDSTDDLYEHAPCGYLSTMLDGSIAKINATLLDWLGYRREDVVGRRRFADLLTVGGRLYHETHFARCSSYRARSTGSPWSSGRLPATACRSWSARSSRAGPAATRC